MSSLQHFLIGVPIGMGQNAVRMVEGVASGRTVSFLDWSLGLACMAAVAISCALAIVPFMRRKGRPVS